MRDAKFENINAVGSQDEDDFKKALNEFTSNHIRQIRPSTQATSIYGTRSKKFRRG